MECPLVSKQSVIFNTRKHAGVNKSLSHHDSMSCHLESSRCYLRGPHAAHQHRNQENKYMFPLVYSRQFDSAHYGSCGQTVDPSDGHITSNNAPAKNASTDQSSDIQLSVKPSHIAPMLCRQQNHMRTNTGAGTWLKNFKILKLLQHPVVHLLAGQTPSSQSTA